MGSLPGLSVPASPAAAVFAAPRSASMEVQLGVGRVYPRAGGRTFRGAFQTFFQSVCEAFQAPREEPGSSLQPPASAPCPPSPRPLPGSPACLPAPEPRGAGKVLPAGGPAMGSPFPGAGELRELLCGTGELLPPPETESVSRQDPLGESAKQLCRAVSASMGLALEALEAPAEPPLPREDCMFALPAAPPPRAPRPPAGDPPEPPPAFAGPEPDLAVDAPTGTGIYRGSPGPAARPSHPGFSLAPAPARIKLESPPGPAAGGGWPGPCRYGADLVPPGSTSPWPAFFAEEGQLYGPCTEPPPGPFGCGRGPAADTAEFPADAWYPAGRAPFAAPAACIKNELGPWAESYSGAYGDVR